MAADFKFLEPPAKSQGTKDQCPGISGPLSTNRKTRLTAQQTDGPRQADPSQRGPGEAGQRLTPEVPTKGGSQMASRDLSLWVSEQLRTWMGTVCKGVPSAADRQQQSDPPCGVHQHAMF